MKPVFGSLLVILLTASCAGAEKNPAFSVNLQEYPLYLKRGFSLDDLSAPDFQSRGWLLKERWTNVIVSKQGLLNMPRRIFLSPFEEEVEDFTFAVPFMLEEAPSAAMPGLFLAGIGDNWEIYLNGTLIQSETHIVPDAKSAARRIVQHHSERSRFFPFDGSLLKRGENILCFRIMGDPTDVTVGFQYSAPYYIAGYDAIRRKHNETLEMILIGGYLLIALYHFLLFINRRKDTYNFFCGAFSLLMGLYYLFRTWGIYQFIPNTLTVVKLEFFFVFFVPAAMGAFAETLCRGKVSLVTKLYAGLFGLLAVSQLALPHPYGSDTLVVWQILAMPAFVWILVYGVLLPFIREVRAGQAAQHRGGRKAGRLSWVHYLWDTYSGNLLLGIGAVVASALADILNAFLLHYPVSITRYSFYVFVVAVTLMLARIYGKLNHELQAKNVFVANMSHEIRTPMNTIMGMAELAAQDKPPPHIMSKIDRIKQAGNILLSIINDILDFSRLEAGKLEIINREYRFTNLIGEVTEITRNRLGKKPIEFAVDIDPAIPPVLVGDDLRIRQILLNLLGNAVKYTDQGRITFRARLKNTRGAALIIEFTVEDTGFGIKKEDLGKLFSEFSRLETRRMSVEGTGLGLAICRYLCRLMDGHIQVESEYGKGSVFTVTLPQGAGQAAEASASAAAGSPPLHENAPTLKERGISLNGVRALVVDDLPSNRQVIAGFLSQYGMEIHSAGSGEEALERAASTVYDIVFMDHMMEGMDGIEAAAALRNIENYAATPVIALTANAIRGMKDFYLEKGFQDYMSKPISPQSLDEVLARWIPAERQTKVEKAKAETAKKEPPQVSANITLELEAQRFDMLKHYRWHFENRLAVNTVYFEQFITLVESLETARQDEELEKQASLLTEAGRRGNVERIREILPAFYEALQEKRKEDLKTGKEKADAEHKTLLGILPNLKKTLIAGDTEASEALMEELGAATLGQEGRELYFLLYDLLLSGDTEKVLGAISLWERLPRMGEGGKQV